jgi:hypothetical protein
MGKRDRHARDHGRAMSLRRTLLRQQETLPEGITRGRCPWCRRVVIVDDNRKVTSHEAPVCRGWDSLMREMPGVTELGAELLPYGDGDDDEN